MRQDGLTICCGTPVLDDTGKLAARPSHHQPTGIALVLLSGVAIAVVPTSAKLAFEAGSNTLTVVTLRGVVGLALMALFMAVAGQPFRLPRPTLALCVAAGFVHALVAYGFIGAVAHIPVGLAVLVYSTHPVLLAFGFHLTGRQRFSPWKLALAFAVLAALVLVLGGGFGMPDATGIGLAALASLSVCGVILLGACAQRAGATSTQVNLCMMAVATAVSGLATIVVGTWSLPSGIVGWLGLIGAGAGVTVGLIAFFAAFRFVGPVRATMISNAEPLLGVLFACVVLGERLSIVQWVGIALAVGTLVLFEVPTRKGALQSQVSHGRLARRGA